MENKDLAAQVAELSQRIAALEATISGLQQRVPVVDEETLMSITAAVAAYMGVQAKVRAVHFRPEASWTRAGREAGHQRRVPHTR